MTIILAFFLSLAVIILGDALTNIGELPIPGAIVGLLLMAAFFIWRGGPDPAMARMFDAVIPHAPILFVPAGAGVVAYLDVIANGFLAIVAVITLGTAATMLVAGLTMQFLLRPRRRETYTSVSP